MLLNFIIANVKSYLNIFTFTSKKETNLFKIYIIIMYHCTIGIIKLYN